MRSLRDTALGLTFASLVSCAAAVPPVHDDDSTDHVAGTEGDDPGFNPHAAAAAANNEAPGTPPSTRLEHEAERQLAAIDAATSFYSHHTHVDEATGTRQFDCSGFVGYALSRVAPEALAAVAHAGHVRARAADFEQAITTGTTVTSGVSLHPVATVAALQPGDLVVWLRPADSTSHNSGHMVVVRTAPVASASVPGEWLVEVIDSSNGHHTRDSRTGDRTGLGAGVITLVADASGHPTGFRWSDGRNARVHVTPVALAHLE